MSDDNDIALLLKTNCTVVDEKALQLIRDRMKTGHIVSLRKVPVTQHFEPRQSSPTHKKTVRFSCENDEMLFKEDYFPVVGTEDTPRLATICDVTCEDTTTK